MAGNDLIQVQVNFFGNWRTVSTVTNHSQFIANSMRNAQKGYPTKRVRAVDASGRLVDML